MFEISRLSGGETTVTVVGDLDLAARDRFPEVTPRLGDLSDGLVVDLCRTTFVDSTGAAYLMTLADSAARQGASCVLRGLRDSERFVLQVCGAMTLFDVDDEHRCPSGD